jgi:hypothetical protein
MSIKELASAALKRIAERHQRQRAFEGIRFEVFEEILRMPEIDADLRSDLADWLVRSKRLEKVELDRRELYAGSWERVSLPIAGIVFSALTWMIQTIQVSGMARNTMHVVAFGWCIMLWRVMRLNALEAIADTRKRLTLMGKVE